MISSDKAPHTCRSRLGASRPSQEYAATRAFYEALGYEGIEEFAADTIWPGNPCLMMVKHLPTRTD
ncbi:MAG TPA: hypothetical protein VK906_11265 [Egicoccus sp.]|nr:hypothetical protein [Egicoccus sp.]HSK23750.1 hypothetical protein [Egicoccus sp.]